MTGLQGQELGTPPLLNERQLTERLARNREAIRNGTALFNGIPITYETELTRYEQVTALLFVYVWKYSQFYVYGQESPGSLPRDFILHSLLWGWWSFPLAGLLPILSPRFPLRAARSRGRVALASKSALWLQGAARRAASCRRGQPIEHDLPEWAPEF